MALERLGLKVTLVVNTMLGKLSTGPHLTSWDKKVFQK